MALFLLIETTTTVCSVAIANDKKIIHEKSIDNGYSHAENLSRFIQEVISHSPYSYKDLTAVSVSQGPGSYTGLRIGVSTAKGLCTALNIPLIAVDTLKALTYAPEVENVQKTNKGIIIPMIDARRMEVYAEIFDENRTPTKQPHPIIIDENSFSEYRGKPVYLIGNGADKLIDIPFKNSGITILSGIKPSASLLFLETLAKWQSKQFENVAYFEPFYLKSFQATKPKKRL